MQNYGPGQGITIDKTRQMLYVLSVAHLLSIKHATGKVKSGRGIREDLTRT
jgi:hypothetical protein